MSRSNPRAESPYKATFSWNGKKGSIKAYDHRSRAEFECPMPFTFILLDELSCVGGFNVTENVGYYSNEVRNTSSEQFVVKTKAGKVAEGLWEDIKSMLPKAKFCSMCYIAYYDDSGQLTIGRLKLLKAALGKWVEFKKSSDPYKCAVTIDGFSEETKGDNKYFVPILKERSVGEETNKKAVDLDAELQKYLGASVKPAEVKEIDCTDPVYDEDTDPLHDQEDDDLPF